MTKFSNRGRKRNQTAPSHPSGGRIKSDTSQIAKNLRQYAKRLGYDKFLYEPIGASGSMDFPLVAETLGIDKKSAAAQAVEEIRLKLLLLFRHYRLVPEAAEAPFQLALHLAIDWVPGFTLAERATRKPGAARLNDKVALMRLVDEIDEIKIKISAKTLKEACREFLVRRKADSRWKSVSYRSVENRYYEGKKVKAQTELMAQAFSDNLITLIRDRPHLSPRTLLAEAIDHAERATKQVTPARAEPLARKKH